MIIPKEKGIIYAIDVDNLLIASAMQGQQAQGYSLETGFQKMFDWGRAFGKILRVDFYLSPDRCTQNDSLWNTLWKRYRNDFHVSFHNCPKTVTSGEKGHRRRKRDNVDHHLIYNTIEIVRNLDNQAKYFCLASGDIDYSPLLWDLKRDHRFEIAFALGSEKSFSNIYRSMNIVAKHPTGDEELIHYFSPQRET